MPRIFATSSARTLRLLALWCLVVALPVYGLSGTLVQLIGASHVHRGPALKADGDLAPSLHDFRRHGHQATHSDSRVERHHHLDTDPTVVTLGGREDDDPSDGSVSSASGQMSTSPSDVMPAPPAFVVIAWRTDGVADRASADPSRLERPPRT